MSGPPAHLPASSAFPSASHGPTGLAGSPWAGTPLLEVRGLSKTFRRRAKGLGGYTTFTAVDSVSFALPPGTTLGLVGESGCGKSTLARMVAGLIPAASGSVLVEGRELYGAGRKARHAAPTLLQMVFQDPYSALNPRLSVGRSIAEPLVCSAFPRGKRQGRVAELLLAVGLKPEDAALYPHEFSGGQRQRIALARALALNPKLLICDEPVSSLDASVQAQVLNLLKDLQDQLGLSYLFISHDLAVISHMSDFVAVMQAGRLVEFSPAANFFAGPEHPYSRKLLAAMPGVAAANSMPEAAYA